MQNKNAYVSQKEAPFPDKAVLVSRTDTKGITTYANDAFVALSGYARAELIGKSHNIVRHPDMPPQAFEWLWDTLKDGRAWRGTVKNRCKNGDHYWVRATVAPIYENGAITGYSSVRRVPTRQQVAEAEALYKQLNASGARIESKYEPYKFKYWTLSHKLQFALQAILFVVLGIGQYYLFENIKEREKGALVAEAQQLANEAIDRANMLMVSGQVGDASLRKLSLEKVKGSIEGVESVRLLRAQPVVEAYGPGLPEARVDDEAQRRAIDSKTQQVVFSADGKTLRLVTPYMSSKDFHGTDCTGCHAAPEGTVLGASDLVLNVESHMAEIGRLEIKVLIAQVMLQIFLFFYIGYLVRKYVGAPAAMAGRGFQQLMQGDMNDEIDISGRDELGRLLNEIQTMQSYLRTVVDEIVTPVGHMQKRITEMDSKVTIVANNAAGEHDHIQQIAGTVEEFSQSVAEVAKMAADSLNDARAMQGVVEQNNRNMELSISATSKVAETVQSSSQTIADLGVSIEKIGAIANAIKDIADQTNLLALNAAIEAARAGEQGRGFAVVADEVRKLAERTASSTKDIASTIGEINAISGAAVQSMRGAVTEVGEGIALIRRNGEGLKEIMSATASVAQRIDHIAEASREQSIAGGSVARGIENLSGLVDSNAQQAREAKAAGDELMESAAGLRRAGYPLTKCAID
ncbi:MAG: PAS domain-containing methyl-accepting chemotaxis protein [Gallionella sp.]